MTGAAASRAWGHGAINWTSLQTQVHPQVRSPARRRLHVATKKADDEGRIKNTEVLVEVESAVTIGAVKQAIAVELPDVPPERMKLIIYGAEVSDEQLLKDVSPTAEDVQVKMQLRRRGAPEPPKEVPEDDEDDLKTVPTRDPYAPAPAEPAEKPPPPPPPPLSVVHVRTMCGGAKSSAVDVTPDMEVSVLREAVAKLPLTIRAWQEDPAAPPPDDAAKKAPPPKEGAPLGDPPPTEKVLLLGVGDDLEIDPASADSATSQLFEGNRLVHLRDGKLLGDYGLPHESVVYFVLEGR